MTHRTATTARHDGTRDHVAAKNLHRIPLTVACIAALLAWSAPMAAAASTEQAPERFSFAFDSPGVLDCGDFEDHYVDHFEAQGARYFDRAGTALRVVIHWTHHSDDVNSASGLTIHEHGHFTETIDLIASTDTVVGNEEIANRPGSGVVVQDTGRAVYNAEGDLVFFAGGREHSEVLIGDSVLCAALA